MTKCLVADAATLRHRQQWRYRGDVRPDFAAQPGPGQESVWDYPRPPRIEPDTRRIQVHHEGRCVADSARAVRVLETASPPTFYLPPDDVRMDWLAPSGARSFCEWKGLATDLDLVSGPRSVAWCYPQTFAEFEAIAGWVAFYPAKLVCLVGGERASAQPGGYYGGWVTREIVGPMKGEPGCDGL